MSTVEQEYLFKHFDDTLSLQIVDYCQFRNSDSEYNLLSKCPELVDATVADSIYRLAILASRNQDSLNAYRLHRKYMILTSCVEIGIANTFEILANKKKSMEWFRQIGPPPGYGDDYFENLEIASQEDSIMATRERYERHIKNSLDHILHPLAHEEIARRHFQLFDSINDLDQEVDFYYSKYATRFNVGSTPFDRFQNLLPIRLKQIHQRYILIKEFFHENQGFSIFEKWFNSMPLHRQFQLIHDCCKEALELDDTFRDVLMQRQQLLLLPELSDLYKLTQHNALLLFEVILKVSLGKENNFHFQLDEQPPVKDLNVFMKHILNKKTRGKVEDILYILPSTKDVHSELLEELKEQCARQSSQKDEELFIWIQEQEEKYTYHIPAIIQLENFLEESLLRNREYTPTPFENYEVLFLLCRTKYLQHFVLILIEKCLQENTI